MKILLIEDDAFIVRTWMRYLKAHDVRQAWSASAGSSALLTYGETLDLVISDFNLGDGTAADLRLDETGIPYILATGNPDAVPEALRARALGLIKKPFRWAYVEPLFERLEQAKRDQAYLKVTPPGEVIL